MNILGIVLLTTLIEGLITYIFGKSEIDTPRPWIKYISLLMGIVLCIAYKIDIPAMAGLTAGYIFVGYIVSGLIIGRGSNYLNDILSMVKGVVK